MFSLSLFWVSYKTNGKATIKYPCLDVIFLVKMFADWGQWLICTPSHSFFLQIKLGCDSAVSAWEEPAQGCIAWLAGWCWHSHPFCAGLLLIYSWGQGAETHLFLIETYFAEFCADDLSFCILELAVWTLQLWTVFQLHQL